MFTDLHRSLGEEAIQQPTEDGALLLLLLLLRCCWIHVMGNPNQVPSIGLGMFVIVVSSSCPTPFQTYI
jgi:hypothetical protein